MTSDTSNVIYTPNTFRSKPKSNEPNCLDQSGYTILKKSIINPNTGLEYDVWRILDNKKLGSKTLREIGGTNFPSVTEAKTYIDINYVVLTAEEILKDDPTFFDDLNKSRNVDNDVNSQASNYYNMGSNRPVDRTYLARYKLTKPSFNATDQNDYSPRSIVDATVRKFTFYTYPHYDYISSSWWSWTDHDTVSIYTYARFYKKLGFGQPEKQSIDSPPIWKRVSSYHIVAATGKSIYRRKRYLIYDPILIKKNLDIVKAKESTKKAKPKRHTIPLTLIQPLISTYVQSMNNHFEDTLATALDDDLLSGVNKYFGGNVPEELLKLYSSSSRDDFYHNINNLGAGFFNKKISVRPFSIHAPFSKDRLRKDEAIPLFYSAIVAHKIVTNKTYPSSVSTAWSVGPVIYELDNLIPLLTDKALKDAGIFFFVSFYQKLRKSLIKNPDVKHAYATFKDRQSAEDKEQKEVKDTLANFNRTLTIRRPFGK